jgi:AraC-like DNA-binding protein
MTTIPTSASSDTLSQVLNAMRISGSVLLKEHYKTPWAVAVPDSDTLNTLLNTAHPVRIAAFHFVEQGAITIQLDQGEDMLVVAGEMVVCFSGKGHTLYQGSKQNVLKFQDIMAGSGNIFRPDEHQQTNCTSLVCGVFLLQDTLLNPLLATLPNILKLNVTQPNKYPCLYGIVNLLKQEFQHQSIGNSYVIQRYLEILCTEAIRTYVNGLPEHATGWLAALKDPVIGRAIEMIHAKPSYHWSVKNLANEVSLSPSRFAARFSSILDESPMNYVTKWRMSVASRMLEKNQRSIEQIALAVGYESLAAFSRAFKRHVGLPPAAWRAHNIAINIHQ